MQACRRVSIMAPWRFIASILLLCALSPSAIRSEAVVGSAGRVTSAGGGECASGGWCMEPCEERLRVELEEEQDDVGERGSEDGTMGREVGPLE